MTTHQDLCRLPTVDCALCPPGAFTPWPLFWAGRERSRGSSRSRGRLHPQVKKQQGLTGTSLGDKRCGGKGQIPGGKDAGSCAPCCLRSPGPQSCPPTCSRERGQMLAGQQALQLCPGACQQACSSQGQEARLGELSSEWGSLSKGPLSTARHLHLGSWTEYRGAWEPLV